VRLPSFLSGIIGVQLTVSNITDRTKSSSRLSHMKRFGKLVFPLNRNLDDSGMYHGIYHRCRSGAQHGTKESRIATFADVSLSHTLYITETRNDQKIRETGIYRTPVGRVASSPIFFFAPSHNLDWCGELYSAAEKQNTVARRANIRFKGSSGTLLR